MLTVSALRGMAMVMVVDERERPECGASGRTADGSAWESPHVQYPWPSVYRWASMDSCRILTHVTTLLLATALATLLLNKNNNNRIQWETNTLILGMESWLVQVAISTLCVDRRDTSRLLFRRSHLEVFLQQLPLTKWHWRHVNCQCHNGVWGPWYQCASMNSFNRLNIVHGQTIQSLDLERVDTYIAVGSTGQTDSIFWTIC